MTTVIYEVVEHDGGWAYKVGDSLSETYATHDDEQGAEAIREKPLVSLLVALVSQLARDGAAAFALRHVSV